MSERMTNEVDILLIQAKAELDDVLQSGNPASMTLAESLRNVIEAVEWLNEHR